MELRTAQQVLLAGIQKDPVTNCWVWIGDSYPGGYGRVYFDGKQIRAHRLSYETFVGPLDDDQMVCHECHNEACINPRHLTQASAAYNNASKWLKNRAIEYAKKYLPGQTFYEGDDEQQMMISTIASMIVKQAQSKYGSDFPLA